MEIKKEFSRQTVFIIGVIILLIVFLPSFYFYQKYQDLKKRIENPRAIAKTEIEKLVEKVGKLILLPTDEEPTLYTVTQVEKIKNQPFFTQAKDGDKVLIYSKARKAILYDPQANKIVEVGPLVIPSPVISPSATASATLSPADILPTTK